MPSATCDPAERGETFNSFLLEVIFPDSTGRVMAECRYDWDGTSTRATGCDGPVIYLRTRNTHPTAPAWALLPDKKRGDPWIRIEPGTDVVTTAAGQLNQLGLSRAKDVQAVTISFTDPTG